jgi:hypothetical protein
VITVKVLFKWFALNSSKSVGGKSTREHADTDSLAVAIGRKSSADYPKLLSRGLSRMFDILYSKFWAATEDELGGLLGTG